MTEEQIQAMDNRQHAEAILAAEQRRLQQEDEDILFGPRPLLGQSYMIKDDHVRCPVCRKSMLAMQSVRHESYVNVNPLDGDYQSWVTMHYSCYDELDT